MKQPPQRLIIGLCGGSASGKSLLASMLRGMLHGRAQILSQDRYYRDHSHLDPVALATNNFDHPQAIDMEGFSRDLARLRGGETIHPPTYCFSSHASMSGSDPMPPLPVTIVEGLFIYQSEALRDCYDLRVYIHVDSDLRLLRRIQRDVAERGRSLESVAAQYLETVKPMHEQHVEPNRELAHHVVSPQNIEEMKATVAQLGVQIESML